MQWSIHEGDEGRVPQQFGEGDDAYVLICCPHPDFLDTAHVWTT
jgi:hypothetical protein